MLDTANGDITGTPTAANPLNFTAQVVDSSGSANGTVSDSCTINVTTPPYVCTIPPSGTQIGARRDLVEQVQHAGFRRHRLD